MRKNPEKYNLTTARTDHLSDHSYHSPNRRKYLSTSRTIGYIKMRIAPREIPDIKINGSTNHVGGPIFIQSLCE